MYGWLIVALLQCYQLIYMYQPSTASFEENKNIYSFYTVVCCQVYDASHFSIGNQIVIAKFDQEIS